MKRARGPNRVIIYAMRFGDASGRLCLLALFAGMFERIWMAKKTTSDLLRQMRTNWTKFKSERLFIDSDVIWHKHACLKAKLKMSSIWGLSVAGGEHFSLHFGKSFVFLTPSRLVLRKKVADLNESNQNHLNFRLKKWKKNTEYQLLPSINFNYLNCYQLLPKFK